MTEPPGEGGGGTGIVVRDGFDLGVAFLRDESGKAWRVSWEPEADPDPRRSLPAGRYGLMGYRVIADDEAGSRWHLSAVSPKPIREIEVRAGGRTKLDLLPRVTLKKTLKHGRAGVAVTGEMKSGLSVYKDGRRIPLGYRLVGRDGDPFAEGDLEYG